jgi:hypothetical protein
LITVPRVDIQKLSSHFEREIDRLAKTAREKFKEIASRALSKDPPKQNTTKSAAERKTPQMLRKTPGGSKTLSEHTLYASSI